MLGVAQTTTLESPIRTLNQHGLGLGGLDAWYLGEASRLVEDVRGWTRSTSKKHRSWLLGANLADVVHELGASTELIDEWLVLRVGPRV